MLGYRLNIGEREDHFFNNFFQKILSNFLLLINI